MKKILLLLVIWIPFMQGAYAESCGALLNPAFTPQQATQLCSVFVSDADGDFSGNVTVAGTLGVTGVATFSAGIQVDGDIASSATNIGAVVATAANTACNTTCAVANGACIFGWDTSGTQSANVACDGATADECLCLPAS